MQVLEDVSVTITPFVDSKEIIAVTDLTANRTRTLSGTNANFQTKFAFRRIAGGAFTLTIAGLVGATSITLAQGD